MKLKITTKTYWFFLVSKFYTTQAYFKTYGGAVGRVNMWIEITHHYDNDRGETVYYSDAKSSFHMKSNSEDTLQIEHYESSGFPNLDRSKELWIGKGIYDEMGGACNTPFVKKGMKIATIIEVILLKNKRY